MKVRYDKLWRLMKDNKMKKSDLAKAAELSPYTMTKLNKDRPVNMEVMMNLCKVFHCDIGDLTPTKLSCKQDGSRICAFCVVESTA